MEAEKKGVCIESCVICKDDDGVGTVGEKEGAEHRDLRVRVEDVMLPICTIHCQEVQDLILEGGNDFQTPLRTAQAMKWGLVSD